MQALRHWAQTYPGCSSTWAGDGLCGFSNYGPRLCDHPLSTPAPVRFGR